ncbi:MAG: hypothetical protein L0Z53_05515 [Acidobacteriales bacterium]|nr:hypothetical protein [Terriglobales bacterium]
MPNQVLKEFRKRYPQYNDIPDNAVMSRISLPAEFRKVFPEYNDFTDDQISNNLHQERRLEQVSMFPPRTVPAAEPVPLRQGEVPGPFGGGVPSLAARQEAARARFRGKIGPRRLSAQSVVEGMGLDIEDALKAVEVPGAEVWADLVADKFLGTAARGSERIARGIKNMPLPPIVLGNPELERPPLPAFLRSVADIGGGTLEGTIVPLAASNPIAFAAAYPVFTAIGYGTEAVTERVFDTPEYKEFFDTIIPLVGGAAAFRVVSKARNAPREMMPGEWQQFGGILNSTMKNVRRMQPDRALPSFVPSPPPPPPTLPPFRGTFAGPSPAPVPGARRGIPVPSPGVAETVRRTPDARRALPAGVPAETAQVPRDVTGAEFQTIIPSRMETGEPLRTPATPEALTEYRQRVGGQFVGAPAPIPLGPSSLERPIPQPGKVFGPEEGRPKLLTEGKPEPVEFVHYTDLKPSGKGRVILSAERRGASKIGEEGRRLHEGRVSGVPEFQPVPGVAVYQKGAVIEPSIAGRRTRLEGRGEFALADVKSPQAQAFYEEGKSLAKSRGMSDTLADQMGQNYMERKLLEAGYDGYRNSEVMDGKSIVLFKDAEAFTPEAAARLKIDPAEHLANAAIKLHETSAAPSVSAAPSPVPAAKPLARPGETVPARPGEAAQQESLAERQQRREPLSAEEATERARAVQESLAREAALEEKLQRVLAEERKVPVEQIRAERERAKAEQDLAAGKTPTPTPTPTPKIQPRLVPRSRRGTPLAERVAERKRLEEKVLAAERATRGVEETGLTVKMEENLEKRGAKVTGPFTGERPSFILKDGSGIVSASSHAEIAAFAQGKKPTIFEFKNMEWRKGPMPAERPAGERLDLFTRQTGAVRVIYPEFEGETNIGLEVHAPLSEAQFSAVSAVVRKYAREQGASPRVTWDIYRGKKPVSGEGTLADFRRAVEGVETRGEAVDKRVSSLAQFRASNRAAAKKRVDEAGSSSNLLLKELKEDAKNELEPNRKAFLLPDGSFKNFDRGTDHWVALESFSHRNFVELSELRELVAKAGLQRVGHAGRQVYLEFFSPPTKEQIKAIKGVFEATNAAGGRFVFSVHRKPQGGEVLAFSSMVREVNRAFHESEPSGPFTLSANPITNPRAWEWIDETVGKPLIEKTIVRPLEKLVGALPSNLRRQLVENPDVKLALHTARKEHGLRKNEIDALTKIIQSEKPDDIRSIIIDRISRGVPEDLTRLSPSAFPHLSAAEYKRRLAELTQTMASEMQALNMAVREEWLSGAKHWYPQLWKHREKLGARVIMGRVFGRAGRLSLTGKEKRILKRRQVEIEGVSDKWHTLDTDGKPVQSFNTRADAEAFVRENSGYFISYFEKGSRGLSTRKFDTGGERTKWAKKNKDSITIRKLWRDDYSLVEQISIEDAARLGLIEDAVYNLQTGVAPASKAIAKARALEQISNTLAQSGALSDTPVAGYVKSSEYGFSITPDLVKNPAIKRLSEGYVPRDVARDLAASLSAERSIWGRVGDKFMAAEKVPRAFVTYLNPYRHIRQFAENELLLYLDNVAAFSNKVAQARNFREFYAAEYGGKPTKMFREFMEDAAETEIGGWRASDLKMKEHLNAVMKKVNDAADAGQPLTLTEAFQTFVVENPKLFNNMAKVHDTVLKLYRATDMAYKYHSYKWYRDHGRSREYAAKRVQEAYFNYETMPPIVRSFSRFVPFRVSVPYQLARIFANHLRNRPFQFAAKAGLTIAAYLMFRDELLERAGYTQKDLDAMGKLAPRTHEIVLPMTDEQGRNISVNLKWMIPFADVMDYEDLLGIFGSQREREKAVRGALPMIVQPLVTGITGRTQWGQSIEPTPPPEKGIGNQAGIWMRRGNAMLDEARVGVLGQYWERIRKEVQDKGDTSALPWWEKAFISPITGTTRRISKKETPALNTKIVWSRAQEVLEGGDGMKGVFATISKYKSGDISEKVFRDNMDRLFERSKEVFEMPVARDARRDIAKSFYDAYSKSFRFDPRQDKNRVPSDVIARTRRFLLRDLKRYEFGRTDRRPDREEE